MKKFDLVLLDLSMPGMSGVEVATKIREIDPQVPIVLMTGWNELPEHEEGLFHSVLGKPFAVSKLKQALQAVLSGDQEG